MPWLVTIHGMSPETHPEPCADNECLCVRGLPLTHSKLFQDEGHNVLCKLRCTSQCQLQGCLQVLPGDVVRVIGWRRESDGKVARQHITKLLSLVLQFLQAINCISRGADPVRLDDRPALRRVRLSSNILHLPSWAEKKFQESGRNAYDCSKLTLVLSLCCLQQCAS